MNIKRPGSIYNVGVLNRKNGSIYRRIQPPKSNAAKNRKQSGKWKAENKRREQKAEGRKQEAETEKCKAESEGERARDENRKQEAESKKKKPQSGKWSRSSNQTDKQSEKSHRRLRTRGRRVNFGNLSSFLDVICIAYGRRVAFCALFYASHMEGGVCSKRLFVPYFKQCIWMGVAASA